MTPPTATHTPGQSPLLEHVNRLRLKEYASASYTKHCGPRAVECAEADLLGEALEALRKSQGIVDLMSKMAPTSIGESNLSGLGDAIEAVLAKCQPNGVDTGEGE